jgi:hypothetical protein
MLENTFYTLGIVSFALNIIILLGVGLVIIFIVRGILNLRNKVKEKVEVVSGFFKHPEDKAAEVGASLIRKCVKRLKDKVFGKKDSNS